MLDFDLKSIIASTASVSTIIQFLTGTVVCIEIVKNKSTADMSSLPFVSGCLSTSLWLRYGFLIDDTSLILVNTIGATLFFSYVVTFYLYSIRRGTVMQQFMFCMLLMSMVLFYVHNQSDIEEARTHLGLICCLVTIMFFAAPLTSLFHVIRIKSTDSMPYYLILATFVVSCQWFIYGSLLNDKFIQIPNFLGCILSAFQLSLFMIYPKDRKIGTIVI
ncbi:unnamed protein product [Callosobruchus maculatus]|uniref:Sugar transporter SWEET1 n=1 Tax=Callosobruchus maculatus TaxID=64391 RepID=A0A653DNA1_CALMS|nr:unnamed protein product [Callosobruchus maculatus]